MACRILYVDRHTRHTRAVGQQVLWQSTTAMRSCTTAPNATSQRLCCCASDCDFDAGYCAEGYSPNTQTAAPTGGSETNEDDTWMN